MRSTGLRYVVLAVLATAGFLAAAATLKVLAFFINLFVPLPIALLTLRSGARSGLLAVFLCAGLVAAVGDVEGMIPFLLQAGAASLLLPTLLRKGWDWDRATAVTLLVLVAGVMALLAVESISHGQGVGKQIEIYAAEEVAQVRQYYVDSGKMEPAQREEFLKSLESAERFMIRGWPAIVAVLGAILLLGEVLILKVFPTTRSLVGGLPFARWKAPEHLVWPLIASGFLAFFFTGAVQTIAINLLVLLVPIYYLQGLAIVTYFFQQRATPLWLRMPGYLMLSLLNPLPLMLAGIGLFDLWGDFRRPRQVNNE